MRSGQIVLLWLLLVGMSVAGADIPSALVEDFNESHPAAAVSGQDVPTPEPAPEQVLWRGDDAHNTVALTFDACSTWAEGDYDEAVIDLLREYEVPATLFLGGMWMLRHPQQTRELRDDPLFEIANHAHAHPDMTELDADEMDAQLVFAQLAAWSITGELPRFFRAPYVRKNDLLVERAARLGLLTVQYDVASGDADERLGADEIAAHVLEHVEPGSIVVLHMNNPELPTAEALPLIFEGLRERDLVPVTIGGMREAGRDTAKPPS